MSRRIERPVLLPFSLIYGLIAVVRNLLFDLKILRSVKFSIHVISVGNITAGGTGKTPHVELLAGLLQNDFNTAVLSRGYKRKTRHFLLVNKKSKVREVGDEPLQISRKFPLIHVAVHKDRVEGIKKLNQKVKKLDLVILDDAYQHRYIKPGLSILLVDYNKPVFRDSLLPAGNLREPRSGIRRADIIIVTKCPSDLNLSDRRSFVKELRPSKDQNVFFTRYQYGQPSAIFNDEQTLTQRITYGQLKKGAVSVMLVTGIANPLPLKNFLQEHARIEEEISFADHHYYSQKDIQLIKFKFEAIVASEKYIMVTEKDAVKLKELRIQDKFLRKALYYIPVEVRFLEDEKQFADKIFEYMKNPEHGNFTLPL